MNISKTRLQGIASKTYVLLYAMSRLTYSSAYKPIANVDRSKQFITISPPEGYDIKASLIFLHGLGDTCFGWGSTLFEVASQIKNLRCVLPTAAEQPVSLNGGYRMPSWYDIKGLDDRADEDCKGIEASRKLVLDLIDKEKSECGIKDENIILGGFSQGGAMSLYTGLQYNQPNPLGGVLCLSGYLPNSSGWKLSSSGSITPLMMLHGDSDQVVRLNWARKSYEKIQAAKITTQQQTQCQNLFKTYAGLDHGASQEEIEDLISFLKPLVNKL